VSNEPSFCVVGAGNGGLAMAASLALRGFPVSLYNRSPFRLAPIKARGGIEASGEVEGFASIDRISCRPEEAAEGTQVLMVAVPANGHRSIAERFGHHLHDGQVVLLNPGLTGGAIEFRNVLREEGCQADVIVAEAQTFLFASRSANPGQVHISRIKNSIPVAALPATDTGRCLDLVRLAFPQFVPAESVLRTSLENTGAVFHPALVVINASRIEGTRGDFQFYIEGNSPSVSRILEALDRERLAVANALGLDAMTAMQWLEVAYDASGGNLFESMQSNPGYYGIKAPANLSTGYLAEDVPMCLVPTTSLGEKFGVPMPTFRAIIHLASLLAGIDFWQQGRTVAKLGVQDLTVEQLQTLVSVGGVW
jgi:opine dehydrogenase